MLCSYAATTTNTKRQDLAFEKACSYAVTLKPSSLLQLINRPKLDFYDGASTTLQTISPHQGTHSTVALHLRVFVFISIPQFAKDRGLYDAATDTYYLPSSWLSVGSGTPFAGTIVGTLLAGPLIERIGRKKTVGVIAAIALLGMIIMNAVQSYWGILGGRIVNSISMGLELNNIPLYMGELSPPAIRGTMVNFFQWWLFFGALIAKIVVYKSNDRFPDSDWSWRMGNPPRSPSYTSVKTLTSPLAMVVQVVIPVILCGVLLVMPESPTWFLSKDRENDARKSLQYIRKGLATEAEIEQELQLMRDAVREQREFHKATTYMDCFRGTNGRRTMISCVVQLLEQFSGNGFMISYSVIFMAQVGIKDPLQASMGTIGMGLAGSTLAFFLSDRIGRRPLMMFSAFFMWAGLWITSGLVGYLPGGVTSTSLQSFLLALLLLWNMFQLLGWASCVWIVSSEVPTNQLREKTMSISTTVSIAAVVFINYIAPFVQNEPGNLGAGIGFVWGAFSFISIFFVYFCVPEMSGRSLEELDELFEAKVPARKFKGYVCHGIGAQITEVQDRNADAHHVSLKVIDAEVVNEDKSGPKTTVKAMVK
ncbi:hypothetical protein B7463_g11270, partial [Scytalidium lignicola]